MRETTVDVAEFRKKVVTDWDAAAANMLVWIRKFREEYPEMDLSAYDTLEKCIKDYDRGVICPMRQNP